MSKDDKYIIIGRIFLGIAMVFAFGFSLIGYKIAKVNENRSPIEEMFHRQLVTTIDSILDSRYPCGITDDNSAYTSIDSLSSVAVPNNR